MTLNNPLSTKLIVQVVFFKPPKKSFDYILDQKEITSELDIIGLRVLAPFGNRTIVGIIIGSVATSDLALDKLKSIILLLDHIPVFSKNELKLLHWVSEYYHASLGEIFDVALPAKLKAKPNLKPRKKAAAPLILSKPELIITSGYALNTAQESAKTFIVNNLNTFKVFLLDGITGSGKTEVYLQIVAEVLALGKQALILVPEINLTPQTIKRFNQRFPEQVIAYHSNLTAKEKLHAFSLAKENLISIVIGTRSAAWLPFYKLGICIIDEEHDISFKQQEGFRYSARDVLTKRAQIENCPIILGSATPALETWYNAKTNKYTHILLPTRAGNAVPPQFSIIDAKQSKQESGLTQDLITKIQTRLDKKEQVLLFLNRRGFAQVLICYTCGWFKKCRACDAKMIMHLSTGKVHCHHCLVIEPIPNCCPSCKQNELDPLGIGTERVEDYLNKLFPKKNIARVDRDTTSNKHSMEKILDAVNNNDIDILIGTQMLAKGHHFPNVTLVAILDIDAGLFGVDFRAPEKLGQLFIQVAGRSGRSNKVGEVVLQTCYPNHPLLQTLITNNYASYCNLLLQERKNLSLPPFSFQALFRAQSKDSKLAKEFLIWLKNKAKKFNLPNMKILGPVPAPMAKKVGFYRMQLLLESTARANLHTLLNNLLPQISQKKLSSKLLWSLDIDPQAMY